MGIFDVLDTSPLNLYSGVVVALFSMYKIKCPLGPAERK